ncbi:MAG: DUF484 family protein [Cellvibrionales bacterium]|nr:DUF484 family protein [Cellvibrionales bacterium]
MNAPKSAVQRASKDPAQPASQSPATQSPAIAAEQVLAYLREHPDFFAKHPQVLADLRLADEPNGTASLMRRQVELLRERERQLRQQLLVLHRRAQGNEALLGRIQTLSVHTAAAPDLETVLAALHRAIVADFGLDSVYLVVAQDSWLGGPAEHLIALPAADLQRLREVLCDQPLFVGRPSGRIRELLCSADAADLASIAMVRLQYREQDAYLVIGSRDSGHFTNDMATDFLAYVGRYLQALLSR